MEYRPPSLCSRRVVPKGGGGGNSLRFVREGRLQDRESPRDVKVSIGPDPRLSPDESVSVSSEPCIGGKVFSLEDSEAPPESKVSTSSRETEIPKK